MPKVIGYLIRKRKEIKARGVYTPEKRAVKSKQRREFAKDFAKI